MDAVVEELTELPAKLADEIVDEITDEQFTSRTHGTRSCHNAGCRGPLCTKFNRDRSRELYRKNNPDVTRLRAGSRDPALDGFLDAVIEAHVSDKEEKEKLSA